MREKTIRHTSLRLPKAGWPSITALSLLLLSQTVQAVCSDHAPASGITVVCDANSPNPDTTGIAASASSGVTVNVLPSAMIQTTTNAIALQSGMVNNAAGAAITVSGSAIAISFQNTDGSSASIENFGGINSAGGDAVDVRGLLVLNNYASGRIVSSGGSAADVGHGGTVSNWGYIEGNAIAAVRIYSVPGRINNFGTIVNGDNDGVFLDHGSIALNGVGGQITGKNKGIEVSTHYLDQETALLNAGFISGAGTAGVLLNLEGGILNQSTGVITGMIGVSVPAGKALIRNDGTITGTGGIAVSLPTNDNTLVISPGSVLNGNAVAGGTGNRLALGGDDHGVIGSFIAGDIGPGQKYQGFALFEKRGSSTWVLSGNGPQDWSLTEGRLLLADTGSIGSGEAGTTTITAGATLGLQGGAGAVNSTTTILNGGTLDLTNGQPGDVMTVNGMLQANGGVLRLDVQLGDSSSPADRLRVAGSLESTLPVQVEITNIGGFGGQTTGDGILLVEASEIAPPNAFQLAGNAGAFQLVGQVLAGSYSYSLVRADNGNWYLRSEFAPLPALPDDQQLRTHVVVKTGPDGKTTIDGFFVPDADDRGAEGAVYVFFYLPGSGDQAAAIWMMDSSRNWHLFSDCREASTAFMGVLDVIDNLPILLIPTDLSSLKGAQLFIGYGLGNNASPSGALCNDMTARQNWTLVYTQG